MVQNTLPLSLVVSEPSSSSKQVVDLIFHRQFLELCSEPKPLILTISYINCFVRDLEQNVGDFEQTVGDFEKKSGDFEQIDWDLEQTDWDF